MKKASCAISPVNPRIIMAGCFFLLSLCAFHAAHAEGGPSTYIHTEETCTGQACANNNVDRNAPVILDPAMQSQAQGYAIQNPPAGGYVYQHSTTSTTQTGQVARAQKTSWLERQPWWGNLKRWSDVKPDPR